MSDLRQLPLFPTLPASPDDLNKHTQLRHTVTLFQEHLYKEGKSTYTVTSFTSDLQLLAEWCGEQTPLGEFNTTRLNDFLNWMEHERGVPCSRKTYARRVTTLKVFFKWLKDIGALEHDPAATVLQRSGPAPLQVILTPAQIADVTAYARQLRTGEKPDARPEVLFRLLAHTGIKKGETVALTLKNIERENPPMLVVRHRSAKNLFKERRIPLDPDWLPLLDEYAAAYKLKDAIFTCTARNLEYILEDLGKGAGVPHKISFEMMRWTCAVNDYLAEMEPDKIREKLGLSKISWQETFAKVKTLASKLSAVSG